MNWLDSGSIDFETQPFDFMNRELALRGFQRETFLLDLLNGFLPLLRCDVEWNQPSLSARRRGSKIHC